MRHNRVGDAVVGDITYRLKGTDAAYLHPSVLEEVCRGLRLYDVIWQVEYVLAIPFTDELEGFRFRRNFIMVLQQLVMEYVGGMRDLQEVLTLFCARSGARQLVEKLGDRKNDIAKGDVLRLTFDRNGNCTSHRPYQLCWLLMLCSKRVLAHLIHSLAVDANFDPECRGFFRLVESLSQPLQQIAIRNNGDLRYDPLVTAFLNEVSCVGHGRCEVVSKRLGVVFAHLVSSHVISSAAVEFVVARIVADLNSQLPNMSAWTNLKVEKIFASLTILESILLNCRTEEFWARRVSLRTSATSTPLPLFLWKEFCRFFVGANDAVANVGLKAYRQEAFLLQDLSVQLMEAVGIRSTAAIMWEELSHAVAVDQVLRIEGLQLFSTLLFPYHLHGNGRHQVSRCVREVFQLNAGRFVAVDCCHDTTTCSCVVETLVKFQVVSGFVVEKMLFFGKSSAVNCNELGGWTEVSSCLTQAIRKNILHQRPSVWDSTVKLIAQLAADCVESDSSSLTAASVKEMASVEPIRIFGRAIVMWLNDTATTVELSDFEVIRHWIRMDSSQTGGIEELREVRRAVAVALNSIFQRIGNAKLIARKGRQEFSLLLQRVRQN